MTQDNEDSFKKPLAVAYFNVDYTLNPKGMHNYFKEINGLLLLLLIRNKLLKHLTKAQNLKIVIKNL